MSAMRTFKAQAGKRIYCKGPNGDIKFKGEFISTDDKEELKTLERAVGVVEVTDTKEGKEEAKAKAEKNKKNAEAAKTETKEAKVSKAKAESEAKAKAEAEAGSSESGVKPLGDDEDVDVMTAERCKELLNEAGVGFAANDPVAKLRTMVKALPKA